MTIEHTFFKARARTIDHLGREQIADCPTAISELWKNSYDAYAKSVALNIFDASDGELPVAALVDDGHGMDKDEFIEKWLVVGTESKATNDLTSIEDRNGLPARPRQGQKGIGRLSSAVMGNLLLLVSKRERKSFVAALVDWRIFENPYLILSDIQIPVVEFDSKDDLSAYLPEMFETLMENVSCLRQSEENERSARISTSWNRYEDFQNEHNVPSTKLAIEKTIIQSSFNTRHFETWPVWRNASSHGTALFISQLSDDLLSQLSEESINNADTLDQVTRNKFFETLSGFVDPYARNTDSSVISDFTSTVNVWKGLLLKVVVDKIAQFNTRNLDQLEHFVEGKVDDAGIFTGKIRVFGEEIDNIVIKPREPLSNTSTSKVGSFLMRFGTFELKPGNTTHTEQQHAILMEMTRQYGGFMLHRDGFRVMPYGREDNDYFDIEKRRLVNAGDYFWSARRTFGGVKITRKHNPNLRDKAGREGLIDNVAAKQFKRLVSDILVTIAQKQFGRNSENRNEILPQIQAENERAKVAAENRKKLINKQRKDLRKKINDNFERLISVSQQLEDLTQGLAEGNKLNTKESAIDLQTQISELSGEVKELDLGYAEMSLGSLEHEFLDYSKQHRRVSALLIQASNSINIALEKLFTEAPESIFKNERDRKYNLINKRILKWETDARHELEQESVRLKELTKARTIAYLRATEGLTSQVAEGKLQLANALSFLDGIYQTQSHENEEIFPPYIGALQSLRDQIDLQGLTAFSVKQSDALREEIGRVHALAQLGITVEVIGHEIEGLDMTIERGLNDMPDEIKKSHQYESVLTAHHSLSEKWRFLSPLKLSGEKIYRDISGADIHRYMLDFFNDFIERGDIHFVATEAFKNFRLNDLPARLYPVFVNLFNNARYWVRHAKEIEKKILMDFVDGKVVIADNGPGVDEDDLSQLFTLFFTRKASGGRGVGLYLCRANLAAGGHSIRYETEHNKKLLSGANFVIEFKGAKNG